MSTKLDRLTELAKEEPKRQFFSIAHLITPEALYAAFRSLRKEASAGVDGVTYQEYQEDAERKIQELGQRLKDGKYQALKIEPPSAQSPFARCWHYLHQGDVNRLLRGHYSPVMALTGSFVNPVRLSPTSA